MIEQIRQQEILAGEEPPTPLPYEQWEIDHLKRSDEETVRFGSFWRSAEPLTP